MTPGLSRFAEASRFVLRTSPGRSEDKEALYLPAGGGAWRSGAKTAERRNSPIGARCSAGDNGRGASDGRGRKDIREIPEKSVDPN